MVASEVITTLSGTLAIVVALLTLVEAHTRAISELLATLTDAWKAADLHRRLRAWMYCCVTHPHLVETPPPDGHGSGSSQGPEDADE